MRVFCNVFNFLHRIGFLRTAATLWLVAAVGFFCMPYFPPLLAVALPFSPLGFFVLGADELTERYGPLREAFYFWLLALPCAVFYALLILKSRRHGNTA